MAIVMPVEMGTVISNSKSHISSSYQLHRSRTNLQRPTTAITATTTVIVIHPQISAVIVKTAATMIMAVSTMIASNKLRLLRLVPVRVRFRHLTLVSLRKPTAPRPVYTRMFCRFLPTLRRIGIYGLLIFDGDDKYWQNNRGKVLLTPLIISFLTKEEARHTKPK